MSLKKNVPFFGLLTGNIDKFYSRLKKDEIFKYSNVYSFNEIKDMAARRGVIIIRYHNMKYGSCAAEVVKNKLIEKEIFHFQVDFLDV